MEKIVWNPRRKDNSRRSKLLNVLLEMVKEDPTITAEELAKRAGITKATVYNRLRKYHIDNQI